MLCVSWTLFCFVRVAQATAMKQTNGAKRQSGFGRQRTNAPYNCSLPTAKKDSGARIAPLLFPRKISYTLTNKYKFKVSAKIHYATFLLSTFRGRILKINFVCVHFCGYSSIFRSSLFTFHSSLKNFNVNK